MTRQEVLLSRALPFSPSTLSYLTSILCAARRSSSLITSSSILSQHTFLSHLHSLCCSSLVLFITSSSILSQHTFLSHLHSLCCSSLVLFYHELFHSLPAHFPISPPFSVLLVLSFITSSSILSQHTFLSHLHSLCCSSLVLFYHELFHSLPAHFPISPPFSVLLVARPLLSRALPFSPSTLSYLTSILCAARRSSSFITSSSILSQHTFLSHLHSLCCSSLVLFITSSSILSQHTFLSHLHSLCCSSLVLFYHELFHSLPAHFPISPPFSVLLVARPLYHELFHSLPAHFPISPPFSVLLVARPLLSRALPFSPSTLSYLTSILCAARRSSFITSSSILSQHTFLSHLHSLCCSWLVLFYHELFHSLPAHFPISPPFSVLLVARPLLSRALPFSPSTLSYLTSILCAARRSSSFITSSSILSQHTFLSHLHSLCCSSLVLFYHELFHSLPAHFPISPPFSVLLVARPLLSRALPFSPSTLSYLTSILCAARRSSSFITSSSILSQHTFLSHLHSLCCSSSFITSSSILSQHTFLSHLHSLCCSSLVLFYHELFHSLPAHFPISPPFSVLLVARPLLSRALPFSPSTLSYLTSILCAARRSSSLITSSSILSQHTFLSHLHSLCCSSLVLFYHELFHSLPAHFPISPPFSVLLVARPLLSRALPFSPSTLSYLTSILCAARLSSSFITSSSILSQHTFLSHLHSLCCSSLVLFYHELFHSLPAHFPISPPFSVLLVARPLLSRALPFSPITLSYLTSILCAARRSSSFITSSSILSQHTFLSHLHSLCCSSLVLFYHELFHSLPAHFPISPPFSVLLVARPLLSRALPFSPSTLSYLTSILCAARLSSSFITSSSILSQHTFLSHLHSLCCSSLVLFYHELFHSLPAHFPISPPFSVLLVARPLLSRALPFSPSTLSYLTSILCAARLSSSFITSSSILSQHTFLSHLHSLCCSSLVLFYHELFHSLPAHFPISPPFSVLLVARPLLSVSSLPDRLLLCNME